MLQAEHIYDVVPLCASRFTGKERDTETGLDYFGARYNASNMGRFMTPDPGNFGRAGGPRKPASGLSKPPRSFLDSKREAIESHCALSEHGIERATGQCMEHKLQSELKNS
jgi:RHS repeat-associated protein